MNMLYIILSLFLSVALSANAQTKTPAQMAIATAVNGGPSNTTIVNVIKVENGGTDPTIDKNGNPEHEYVDLGLPSGTLWATCNLGATKPEEYGSYYAWAETMTKVIYDWAHYRYCINGSAQALTKYNSGSKGSYDGKKWLVTTDDAAYVNWGVDWRMPTYAQMSELFDIHNTTAIWTTQNGVNGELITSLKNGNSIFLPAAGHYEGSSLYNEGYTGYYLTLQLSSTSDTSVWGCYFISSKSNIGGIGRQYGSSVRPVRNQ